MSSMAKRVATKALQTRLYSASAASAPRITPKPTSAAAVVVSKASNGISVATQESQSSLARVVCAVKAGSRYEDSQQRGAAHCLRVITDQTQREVRAFRLTRELGQMGGSISCSTSRENILYTLEVPTTQLDSALPLLAGMVAGQSFRPWEIGDCMPRLEYELLTLREQPDQRVVERVHEAAYRDSGLGRSIYAPAFQISEFTPDLLREYVGKYFTADRISLSGIGVSQETLLAAAATFDIHAPPTGSDVTAKYHSGEIRESSEDLLAYTVLVGEGASLSSGDLWAYATLEQLLGSGHQIKWASQTTSNKINSALATKTEHPFIVQSFNVNYSDSGLFGVSAVTVPENSELVLKTAVEQLREIASKPVDSSALQGAKNRVKATVAFQSECAGETVSSRAIELLNTGKVPDLKASLGAIDGVTAAAVQSAAQKIVKSKLSMASIGEIHGVPYVGEL